MCPQGTVTLDLVAAVPGQTYGSDGHLTDSFIASEALLPGRLVELDPSNKKKVRLPKTATAIGALYGVVLWDSARTTGGYAAGESVPVCYQGDVYVESTATTDAEMTAAKVRSASTDANSEATHRGKVTDASTSATAGQEVYQTKVLFLKNLSDSSLALVRMIGPVV